MTPATAKPAPRFIDTAAGFRAWLDDNAARQAELIVGLYKVGSGRRSMSWPESVDEALCPGWIDGVRARIDDIEYRIRFSPRKTRSIWSAVNIAKFQQLSAQGRMTAAGALAFSHRCESKSVVSAKRPDTRASRLARLIEGSGLGQRLR